MKDYMTVEEAKEYFHVSRTTLDEWRTQGLVVTKIGSRVFFADKDIQKFMDNHRQCDYTRR